MYNFPKGQRTHVLRHSLASHFVINGGNLLTLQKILGHQSIQMNMRCAHLTPDHLKETVTLGPKVFG
ncbi:tyrosine-type recombinase/integrase [Halomonas sp. AOP13-D3-9]